VADPARRITGHDVSKARLEAFSNVDIAITSGPPTTMLYQHSGA
jgi:hypothetical protein